MTSQTSADDAAAVRTESSPPVTTSDQAAFEGSFTRHYSRVYQVLFRITGNRIIDNEAVMNNDGGGVYTNIRIDVLDSQGTLRREPQLLLMEELREPRNYSPAASGRSQVHL